MNKKMQNLRKLKSPIAAVLFFLLVAVSHFYSCSEIQNEDGLRDYSDPDFIKEAGWVSVQPSEGALFGIISYNTAFGNGSLAVTPLIPGASFEEAGQIIISREGTNDCIYYDNASDVFHIWWDRKLSGRIRILINEKEFIIDPRSDHKGWNFSMGSAEELSGYSSTLKMISAIAADFDESFFMKSGGSVDPEPVVSISNLTLSGLKSAAVSMSEGQGCNGETFESDVHYAWTAEECCSSSNSDVNSSCANTYCSTCCELSCSWTGVFGEYMGCCISTGTSCSE